MWVNQSWRDQDYLYPANSETDLQTDFVVPVMEWVKATGKGDRVNFWYDGQLVPSSAIERTKRIFEREALKYPDAAAVHFRDIRELPEVQRYPEVFSEKIPVYFRVDLLRALAGYHTLISQENQYFVYGDIDMKPLSKDELFDGKTQRKLNKFGIVMTRGGIGGNLQPFENGFQMVGRNKPNLLKAMKVAIIDLNIKRALHILNGGRWTDNQDGNTKPLEEIVYGSYKNMFYYYYHLEDWGDGGFEETNIIKEFGITFINNNSIFKAKNSEIVYEKEFFSKYDGKVQKDKTIKVPTKIVVMPSSHFGFSPIVKYDPDKISMKNFQQKLQNSLEGKSKFDNALLYLVARNNYLKGAQLIIDKLTPEELTEAVTNANSKFGLSRGNSAIPLLAAIEEGHQEFIRLIVDHISSKPELLEKIAHVVALPYGSYKKSILSKIAGRNHIETLHYFITSFATFPQVVEASIWALLEIPAPDKELFRSLLESAPDAIFEKIEDGGESLALKAANGRHHDILKIIAEKAPQTFIHKDKEGMFPLLCATEADVATFTTLWQAAPNMLTEKSFRGRTVAHEAAACDNLQVIQLIAEKAPELLSHQDNDRYTPADEAASNMNCEVLKFLIDHHPDTLKLKNRYGWSAAATAANSNNVEGMKYLIEKMADLIISDFSNIYNRAKFNSPDIVELLTEKFPQQVFLLL